MSLKRKSGRYPWSDGGNMVECGINELHINESYVRETLKLADKLLLDFVSDMMRINGTSLEEIDPEEMAMINRYIKAWKDLCNGAVDYARKEDEMRNGLIKRFARMEEKEDRILAILENRNLKL